MLKKIHWLLLASSTMACSVTINAPADDGGWFDGCGPSPGSKDAGADSDSGLSGSSDGGSNVADGSSSVADASSDVADASSATGSAAEIEAFQRAQAAAFCATLASACGAPSGWQTEQCISTYSGGFSNVYEDLLVPGVKTGGHLAFDATRAAACLDKLTHMPMPVRTAAEHRAVRDACDYVVVGTLPRGASCRANIECTSNDACIGRKDGVGTCGIIRGSQLKCEFPTETKQRSNTCSYHGIGQSGLFCSSTDPSVGVCQRQAPVGYACVSDFQCTTDLCAPNPAGGGNVCVDRYDELAVNGTCSYFGGATSPAPVPTVTATVPPGPAPGPAPTPIPTATGTADPVPVPVPEPGPVPVPVPDPGPVPPLVGAVTPQIIDKDGDSFLTIAGVGLSRVAGVTLDGAPIPFRVDSNALVFAKTPAVTAGPHTVALVSPSGTLLAATVEAWSPTELSQVHVFDARDGVARSDAGESHLWTRRTAMIAPSRNADGTTTAWTHRDGPCVVYLQNTHKYWMIGGWNTFAEGPYAGWPTDSTNEVWSSPDGATWTLELPHAVDPVPADRFSPRHFFGCNVLNDRLYMIGGDYTDKLRTVPDGDEHAINGVWMTALGPYPFHETVLLRRDGAAAYLRIPEADPTSPELPLLRTADVSWYSHGRRRIDMLRTKAEDELDRPQVCVRTARVVRHGLDYAIVGELVNVDADPADLTIRGTLRDERGAVVASYNAQFATLHKLLPGEETPFRIDFSDPDGEALLAKDARYDPTWTVPTRLREPPKRFELFVKSVVGTKDLLRPLTLENGIRNENSLQGMLFDHSSRASTIPVLLLASYTPAGDLRWVADRLIPDGVRPGRTLPVEIPLLALEDVVDILPPERGDFYVNYLPACRSGTHAAAPATFPDREKGDLRVTVAGYVAE